MSNIKEKLLSLAKILSSALLLSMQTIIYAGVATTIMTIPLFPYIYLILRSNFSFEMLKNEFRAFGFGSYFVALVILLIGLVILAVAGGQWLWYHHKRVGLFRSGLYARVRHPQFTGIIIITLGLTVMVLLNGSLDIAGPFLNGVFLSKVQVVGLWFLQVLGYIAIARFEEWQLSKKYPAEFEGYKQKVPFLFPIKSPKKIRELLFTLLIVILVCFVLLVLPYNSIAVYCGKVIPDLFPLLTHCM
jgi:protein-S-isoprenylcysteine O-methyltransferase Ste14